MNEQNLKFTKSNVYKICLIIFSLLFSLAVFIPFLTNYYGKTFGFFNGILEFFDTFIKVDKYSGNPILNFIIYLVFAISILSMCIISFIKNTHYLLNKEEKEDTLFLTIGIGLYLGAAFFTCIKRGAIYLSINQYNGTINSQSFTPFFGYMCLIAIIYFIFIKIKYYDLSLKNLNSKLFIKCCIESLCLIFAFIAITSFFNLDFGTRTTRDSFDGSVITNVYFKDMNYFIQYLKGYDGDAPKNGELLIFVISSIPLLLAGNFVIQSLTSKKLFIVKICSNIVALILVIVPFIIFASIIANSKTMVFLSSSNLFIFLICLIPLILNILEKIFLDRNTNY